MHYVRPLDWREGGGGKKRKTSYFVIKYGKGKRELTAPETRWRFRGSVKFFFFLQTTPGLCMMFLESKVPDKEMSPNFFLFFRSHTFFTFFTFTSTW